MKKQEELVKQEEHSLTTFKEEGFAGIDQLPIQVPRFKVDKDNGLFIHSLTEKKKRSLLINPLLSKAVRALWNGEDLPICSSGDCKNGVERETGNTISCASCGNNQFGTSASGKGKACKQSYLIMAVESDRLEPFIIAIPPTSLKLIGEYFQKLAAQKVSPRQVYAELNLKETSSSGFSYQLITWDIGNKVDEDRLAELNNLVAGYQATFSEAVVERDEQVGDEGPSKRNYKEAWDSSDPSDPSDDSVPF